MDLEVILTDHWGEWLEKIPATFRDIYFRESYVKLYQNEQDKALCVVVSGDNYCALMPILSRKIDDKYSDFETPYGYGGFISNSDHKELNSEALSLAIKFFANKNYVAGFVRFHPLLGNAEMCRQQMTVIDDRKTIAMDLRPTVYEIWMNQVHPKNRNTIKKAEKRGLEFVTDYDFIYMADFVRLYNATMDKLHADGFYYFDQEYYDKWLETLKERSFLSVVKYEGEVIASCIIMYDGPYGHYHLSGSNKNFLNLEPNNFMLWNAALELKKLGVEHFHLGGGIDSNPENSLYKFKSRLSPINCQFSFGKLIFNNDIYNQLCQNWAVENPDKVPHYGYHLLKYRY